MIEYEVGTFEAKNRLSALLDRAARGERIWITKRGKRVALLSSGIDVGPGGEDTLSDKLSAVRARAGRGSESLKALIEDGRR